MLKSRVKALIRRKRYQDEDREAARANEKARMADELAEKNRILREKQTQLVQAEKMPATSWTSAAPDWRMPSR